MKIGHFVTHKLCLKRLVSSTIFNAVMMGCIILNCVTIIMAYLELSTEIDDIISTIEEVLLYVYTGEAVLKIIGLGPLMYFRDSWNLLDFVLVIISLIVDVTFNFLKSLRSLKIAKTVRITKVIRIQRAFRIIRVFRGLKFLFRFKKYLSGFNSVKRIVSIIKNSVACLMTLQSVLATMLLLVYIFAVIAPEAFFIDDIDFKIRTLYS